MKGIITVGLVLLLTACTTQEARDKHDYGMVTSGDFTFLEQGVKTYSWHPNSERAYLPSEFNSSEITEMVRNSIESEMNIRGYRLRNDSGEGDVIIGFGLAAESVLRDSTIFDHTKLSTGVPFYDKDGKLAEKGSLYIVMYRPNMAAPQWQTLTQSGIEPNLSLESTEKRLETYIEMILRGVPTVKP
ncbi:DUF4136 domain-containing protein [Vibrio makurazakiensis]|uniref:DUF4136 domain-containing protein n=1 Tax=Vibrio makurazakiensis TaxID=2910250 RepID=UPI003D0E299F